MKYYIITFGCQMNESDSERIAAVFEKAGLRASRIDDADFIVVNMCSVRQSAVDRIYGLKPIFKKLKSKKILTGCVLKRDKKKMSDFFDYILDVKDLAEWPISQRDPASLRILRGSTSQNYLNIIPKYSNKSSANVPIMTGCDNFCAYCVVPYSRGKEISRPAKEIICEVKNLIKKGYREIWLLGQNVNSYKDQAINFPKLLKMINDIPGRFWIRFTSSHPKDLSDELIKTMARCNKLPKYLNLPMQAGDDKILKKMNRPYTIAKYKNLIKKIRKAMPEISISTDVIVGFPGETKKQFENTAKLFREIKFDMAYINKYSPRAGTAAAKIKDNVSPAKKTRREKVLTEILKKTALEHNKKLLGKETKTLISDKIKGKWIGKTEGYKTIQIESDKNMLGKFVDVKIIEATPWGLNGEARPPFKL